MTKTTQTDRRGDLATNRDGARPITVRPGESPPPGAIEIRPQIWMSPEFSPPSILDYHPRSTLVTSARSIAAAQYPVIDFHAHALAQLNTAESRTALQAALDAANVRLIVCADNLSGERLKRALALVRQSNSLTRRVLFLAGIDFDLVGPGWAEKAIAQLRDDIDAGAVGVGEIRKAVGLTATKADGSRLRIDDAQLDPIWDECARLQIPVFLHTADPQAFFDPLDWNNERWLELALFGDRRHNQEGLPSFEDLITERNNLFRGHPGTIFVAAHLGWHANDFGRLGELLDKMPNVYADIGAVLHDIGRQPRAARDFFIKYQDRVLFGKDSSPMEGYSTYWRVLETCDEYFDHYRAYHAFWKLYGIDLPSAVLQKLYFRNALNITRGLPRDAWPERVDEAVV
jgi:predicted TIM-barrel fold metal-dependent hydrolase